MANTKGNRFWELRSKHGRDLLFETPELLWESACEYFDWCSKNPWNKIDFKGADLKRVKIPTERPLTLNGLCLYIGCSTSYFRVFKKNAIDTEDERKKDFLTVIARIEDVIFTQQFEGATVGAFNSNIIARSLGMYDTTKVIGDPDNPLIVPSIIVYNSAPPMAGSENDVDLEREN